ncbi:hypothetical protein [Haloplanus halobius]|uniref:hypothetical protein n=1 Tax=Haloplanus halobius TaxID=2934938 RepID=UPI00200C7514|nr:hypothetical protein [Haloplanus sp. XH21]
MGRSRRRGKARRRVGSTLALLAIVAVMAWGPMFPAAGFTSMSADRQPSLEVTEDSNSVMALDTATSVASGTTSTLTNTTNNFGQTMQVTVSLREASQDDADLVVNGVQGDSVTFEQQPGTTETVDVNVQNESTLTDTAIYFDTSATATGISARAENRTVPIN